MLNKVKELYEEVIAFSSNDADEVEQFRIQMLGRKGAITELFKAFRDVPPEQKKEFGQELNKLRKSAEEKVEALKKGAVSLDESPSAGVDLHLPSEMVPLGSRHPISIVRNEIVDIFKRAGFVISEGPEIEDDWHNFTALNFPPEHPARDMQDTFFVDRGEEDLPAGEAGMVLRTHTSSVQIRVMENEKPPIRTISPGRVYRNETVSARSNCFFHQVEGLYIDKGVSFADLKQILLYFAKEMFGENSEIRLRPSYFPFTEPSAEVDVSCNICNKEGCNVCKYTGYLEILGCGMVDPNVLENCGIDSSVYSGYAFGMGIDRVAMMKYNVNDLRLFFDNDVRFLGQFKSAY